ncbi:hypothetical protein EKE94_06895 [Mesobaculum littorinae]|uniref:Anti-sigma K factor RskA C-terminal domain-containing protein n=1 Tax=Mesobaculum littorinae TaxID=2486419 RepID=A0A438AJ47_9RHOB|nr:anti-sigma factor [Mesobaculum littorinae]RVV98635.1 hypothetical protein EKE94_06895 [Mesobaculum littorinae]
MSDAATYDDRDDAIRAAEYVLRLLDTAEMRAFEARLELEGALRGRVAFWEERFLPLIAGVPEVAPPPSVRREIERRIAPSPDTRQPKGARTGRLGRPARVSRARGWLAAAFVAAHVAALIIVTQLTPPPTTTGPVYVAEVQATARDLVLNASIDSSRSILTVARQSGTAGAGRDYELWVIPADGPAPLSLGLLDWDGETRRPVPQEVVEALQGGTFAVSDEPAGGSPTGAPTGEIVATAPLTTL